MVTSELTESYSAREPGRPIFSKLLADIATGKVERILSWKLDRLARNPVDGGTLIHYLGNGFLKEIVTLEGTYTGAGDSKFMLSVLFGAATKMTDDLSQGVRRGNRSLCERGRIPGVPPIGYMKIRDVPGFRGAGQVVPDPDRFELVRRVWQRVLAGDTVAEVWRQATEQWSITVRPTRHRPSHAPGPAYFYALLSNRFYAGQIVRNGEVYQGEHPPMVTLTEFDEVQRLMRRVDAPRPRHHDFLYTGLLRCEICGHQYVGELIKGRYIYYRCGRRRQGRERCLEPAPSESQVTNDIEKSLATITLNKELADWTAEAMDLWFEQESNGKYADVRSKQDELARLEQQIERLTDLVVAGHLAEAEYVTRKSALLDRRTQLARIIEEPLAEIEAWRQSVKELMSDATLFLDGFRNGDSAQRRELIQRLYENCPVSNRVTKRPVWPAPRKCSVFAGQTSA
jgi:site-specific DNA recombinase